MSDELLRYYEKELAFIRQLGAEFAKENPKIAGRLNISTDTVEDPHVSRLIEGFAYLNARLQHKLNDDIPELSDALLNVVFPHYQRPIPSMSIVQFAADPEQLDGKFHIPARTELDTDYFQGEMCRFSTGYEVELFPFKVAEASLMGRPFLTPGAEFMRNASSVLRLKLQTFNNEIKFSDLKPDRIRFYLKGQTQHIHPLYEFLLRSKQKIAVVNAAGDTKPKFLDAGSIKAVGFNVNEGLLPYPPASFVGYRLLTEFMVFPEKFMFIDICGLAKAIKEDAADCLEIYIYLEDADIELEHNLNAATFALGCTPVINLFEHKTDPIKLSHTRSEYHIVPDARRPKGFEVYSIDQVTASTSSGEKTDFLPLYGMNHSHQDSENHSFWFAARRHAKLSNYERDEGTDVFLSLVDLELNPNVPEDRTLTIKTHCSNRDLPAKLPFTMDQPRLQCANSAPPCSSIRCLTQPSVTVRPVLGDGARWRLISHLNLNHLSLTGGNNATEALKEILRLYDFKETSVTRALINSIVSVDTRPISAPLPIDGRTTMCRGMEIEITLDDALLTGSSKYLYANILDHFFALYCSVNSFSRVLIKLKNKEGYLKKCPPRAGEKILL